MVLLTKKCVTCYALVKHNHKCAEIGNCHGSEHVMVRAKILIKLTSRKKQRISRSLNYLKLKDPGTINAF